MASVVVRARHTPRELVQDSIGHLRAEKILGTVFNDYTEILPRGFTRTYARDDGHH